MPATPPSTLLRRRRRRDHSAATAIVAMAIVVLHISMATSAAAGSGDGGGGGASTQRDCRGFRRKITFLTNLLPFKKEKSNILLVNTIDGHLYAFEVFCNMEANLLWSKKLSSEMVSNGTNQKSLFSTSMLNNKSPLIIPSINGDLYSFDSEKLTKVDPDSIKSELGLTRRQQMNIYGIDLFSGHTIYECVTGFCKQEDETIGSSAAALTILLVESKFSFHSQNNFTLNKEYEVSNLEIDELKLFSETSSLNNLFQKNFPFNKLKIQMSTGSLVLLDDDGYISFKTSLNSPVANAWVFQSNGVTKVPLFSDRVNPSLDLDITNADFFAFFGQFNNQLFIKDTPSTIAMSVMLFKDYHKLLYDFIDGTSLQRNLNNITSLSPSEKGVYLCFNIPKDHSLKTPPTILHSKLTYEHFFDTTAHEKVTLLKFYREIIFICLLSALVFQLTMWRVSWHNRKIERTLNLSPASSDLQINKSSNHCSPDDDQPHSEVQPSVDMTLLDNNNFGNSNLLASPSSQFNDVVTSPVSNTNFKTSSPILDDAVTVGNEEFKSRFFDDFKFISMLGRGSFGIVYRCKHDIDFKEYAIKQINLPNRKISREKLFREVHALAHLDHPNILRYYQSWVEEPTKRCYKQKARETFLLRENDPLDMSDFEYLLNPSVRLMTDLPEEVDREEESCMLTFRDNVDEDDDDDNGSIYFIDQMNCQQKNTLIGNPSGSTARGGNRMHDDGSNTIFPMLYIQSELCVCSLNQLLKYGDEGKVKIPRTFEPLEKSSNKEKYNILRQLACAIDYVHKKGLMHRDLKPANIFFNSDKVLKLGDFGLVVFKSGSKSDLGSEVKNQLSTDNIKATSDVGTYLYMAPEVLTGRSHSQKLDIYSMALIFYEVLCLFDTYFEKLQAMKDLRANARFIPEFVVKYKEATRLIKFMLTTNPKKRYSSAKVLVDITRLYENEIEE